MQQCTASFILAVMCAFFFLFPTLILCVFMSAYECVCVCVHVSSGMFFLRLADASQRDREGDTESSVSLCSPAVECVRVPRNKCTHQSKLRCLVLCVCFPVNTTDGVQESRAVEGHYYKLRGSLPDFKSLHGKVSLSFKKVFV